MDRLPVQVNYTPAMADKLASHYGIVVAALPARLGNHLRRVELTYPKRRSADGTTSYDWWDAGWDGRSEGYWHAWAPLADSTDLDAHPWPDPNAASLLDDAARTISGQDSSYFIVPNFSFCLFERAWSLRGFHALLMDLSDRPEWVQELLDRITDIQTVLARRFVAAGVDGGYFADDYGTQRGMLISAGVWRRLVKPRLARMFAPFKEAGLPVILHSDGDIRSILADLIEIGVTVLNPVQPEILDHRWLMREFGGRLSFYGGISTQRVLPRGTPEEVRQATADSIATLAPRGTGLVAGPSHRLQTDVPAENVDAMLAAFPRDPAL